MQMNSAKLSRRELLKGAAAAGALVVSFDLFGPAPEALAQSAGAAAALNPDLDPRSLDSWLAIGEDGSVTIFSSKVDLGTGVETALMQIVADELDVPFARVRMEAGDTSKSVDQGITAGSRTIERAGPQLRQAAAAARQQLLKLAAARLNAPAESLQVSDGMVSVADNPAKKVSYAALLGGRRFHTKITASGTGWDLKVAPEVPAKNYKDYKIVGRPVKRVDLPPKFTAEFTYTQDVRVPGMLHGRVVRPPRMNSAPASVDENSIRHIPGVVKIVRQGNFLGVAAETEWAAIQAARALKVSWTEPAKKLPASAEEVYRYLNETKPFREVTAVNRGNIERAIAEGRKIYEASYRWPFQMHGMLAPSCAVADVRGDRAIIWAGSQGPFDTRNRVARLLNIPKERVQVIYRESSGCYGRLGTDDAAEDAAVMSRATGRPVRVQWMREDEHGWEPKGPAQLLTVRAAVDAQGKITAWDFLDRSFPWTESGDQPLIASRQTGLTGSWPGNPNGTGGGGDTYSFENQKITAAAIPWVQPVASPLRTSPLRAPGDLSRVFASESFMDELAAAQKMDPLRFRLNYAGNARARAALEAVAKLANWQERPAPGRKASGGKAAGRGIAVTSRATTVVAAVAEVEVDLASGGVTVKKVSVAHDCGLIINPDGLKNQIEGNVIQGTSRALLEEVLYDPDGIKTLDWASYPILRYEQIPAVEITLINRPEMPALGGGEPSIGPVPAAIANAIFDATGARLREAPFTPARVRAAMQQSGLA